MTRWKPQNSCCRAEDDERVLTMTVSKRKGHENLTIGKHVPLLKAQGHGRLTLGWTESSRALLSLLYNTER